ncbi:MAG: permease [Actinomycetota bacterium]
MSDRHDTTTETTTPEEAPTDGHGEPTATAAHDATGGQASRRRSLALLAGGAALWALLYVANEPVWDAVVGDLVGLDLESRLGHAVHFFLYDVVKIMLLVGGLIYVIGLLRSHLSPERVRAALAGRRAITGYLVAAAFGAVTPFCSCSSVPLFIGFVAAGVPIGVTLTFLITSPLINQVGVVMLLGMFGWEVPALYVATGMTMAVAAGLLLSRLNLDQWVEPFVFDTPVGQISAADERPSLADRMEAAKTETIDIVKTIWPYVLVGIGLGAAIHGWMPEDVLATYAGPDNPFAVPVAAVAGIPLYANVASVVPLVEALWAKGMGLGTLMAFMMSVVALSLPSLILLKRVLKTPLIVIFTAVVTVGILGIGYLFNLVA